jgi:hypothetical protein
MRIAITGGSLPARLVRAKRIRSLPAVGAWSMQYLTVESSNISASSSKQIYFHVDPAPARPKSGKAYASPNAHCKEKRRGGRFL